MVSNARLVEFLSLVEVGVVRRSFDGAHIEVRRPGSTLFERADDLDLDQAARASTAHGWVVVSHGTTDGTWILTAPGCHELARRRPRQFNELGGPMNGGTALPPELMSTPVPVAQPSAAPRTAARVTFAPSAPGPSWLVDVTDLDAEALMWRLSTPQRAELRQVIATLSERLSQCP